MLCKKFQNSAGVILKFIITDRKELIYMYYYAVSMVRSNAIGVFCRMGC